MSRPATSVGSRNARAAHPVVWRLPERRTVAGRGLNRLTGGHGFGSCAAIPGPSGKQEPGWPTTSPESPLIYSFHWAESRVSFCQATVHVPFKLDVPSQWLIHRAYRTAAGSDRGLPVT